MSLLETGTKANPNTAYYSGGGGGGGASTITTSVLSVSSIQGSGGSGVEINGGSQGIKLDGAGGTFISAPGLFFPTNGTLAFQDTNGALTGVSSINGAAYPPAAAAAAISTFTTGGGHIGANVLANLNPIPLTTTPNKWYQASLEITDMTFTTVPAATDCFVISIEDATSQTNLGTFNMSQISTNRGVLNECGFSVSGPYEALSTNAYFTYKSNAGAASTFLVSGGTGWLMPLN